MKTFNLAIAALAIAAAASTSAFASSLDANGNIPNHESNIAAGATDSYNSNSSLFVDRSGNAMGLTQNDATILKLRTSGDTDPRVRTQW